LAKEETRWAPLDHGREVKRRRKGCLSFWIRGPDRPQDRRRREGNLRGEKELGGPFGATNAGAGRAIAAKPTTHCMSSKPKGSLSGGGEKGRGPRLPTAPVQERRYKKAWRRRVRREVPRSRDTLTASARHSPLPTKKSQRKKKNNNGGRKERSKTGNQDGKQGGGVIF